MIATVIIAIGALLILNAIQYYIRNKGKGGGHDGEIGVAMLNMSGGAVGVVLALCGVVAKLL